MTEPMSTAAAAPTHRAHRADPIEIGGLAVVTTAAVVLSFSALAGLGVLVGFGTVPLFGWDAPLSLLVPLCIDAYGATASRIAVNRAYSAETRRQAMIHGMIAIGVGIAGNACYHLIEGGVWDLGGAMWVLVIAVSIVPPVALGALVHLMSLCARDRRAAEEAHEPAAVPAAAPAQVREPDGVPARVREPVDVLAAAGGRPAPPRAVEQQAFYDLGLPQDEPSPYPVPPAPTPPVPEPPPAPEPELVRAPALPADADPLHLRAVETFAPDGELDRIPPLRTIKTTLNVGQPKATEVQRVLTALVAS